MTALIALPIYNGVLVIINADVATVTKQCAALSVTVGRYERAYIDGKKTLTGVSVEIDHDTVNTADAVRRAVGASLPSPIAGELAALLASKAKQPVKASKSASTTTETITPPKTRQNAPQSEIDPSGAGWYAWRWWVNDEARIVYEKDYPYFGGNVGGAHDLFGPFATRADAVECGAVMGVAFRPIIRPQSLPRLALPAPKAAIVRQPLVTPSVIALPAPPRILTFTMVREEIKNCAPHIAAMAELDEQYTYYGFVDEAAALSRVRTENNATIISVIGKTSSIHIVGVRREFTGAVAA